MSRYIDADKLMNDVDRIDISYGTDIDDIIFELEKIIHKQPTADVVEVVRCKDCKYRGTMLSVPKGVFYTCKKYLLPYCKPDDYCSYGERMDGMDGDME